MASGLNESDVERIVLGWFGERGYSVLHGPDIAPGEPGAERSDYARMEARKCFARGWVFQTSIRVFSLLSPFFPYEISRSYRSNASSSVVVSDSFWER